MRLRAEATDEVLDQIPFLRLTMASETGIHKLYRETQSLALTIARAA
jgi:hypothetical protein